MYLEAASNNYVIIVISKFMIYLHVSTVGLKFLLSIHLSTNQSKAALNQDCITALLLVENLGEGWISHHAIA